MSARRAVIALILLGILVRLALLIWAKGTMVDDAYISLRYADNLIHGKGLVYNEGLRVLSTTSPLYTLWIALLLFTVPGVDPGYTLGITNLVFFGLVAWWIWAMVSAESRRTALLILIFFSAFIRFVDNSIIGMETPLFLLAIMLSLVLLEKGRLNWVSLILALSMLVRPEGVLWAGAILVAALLTGVKPRLRHLLPAAIVVAAWLGFSLLYYGSPIPFTLKAKSGWFVLWESRGALAGIANTFTALALIDLPHQLGSTRLLYALQLLVACGSLAVFSCGLKYLLRRRSILVSFPLLFILYLIFYLIGRGWVEFSWYGIPSGLAYLVTVAFGLKWLGNRVARWVPSPAWLRAAGLILVVILVSSTVVVWQKTRLPYYVVMRSSYEKSGELVAKLAGPKDRVFVTEAGMIGYRAQRFVYDFGGLISPEVLELYRKRSLEVPLAEVWREYMPEFLVVTPRAMKRVTAEGDLAWLKSNYETVGTFPGHQVLRRKGLAATGEDLPSLPPAPQ